MKLKEVKAFKCSDDEMFESQLEAEEHQRKIDLHQSIEKLVEDNLYSGMTKNDVVEFIEQHIDEFVKIANGEA